MPTWQQDVATIALCSAFFLVIGWYSRFFALAALGIGGLCVAVLMARAFRHAASISDADAAVSVNPSTASPKDKFRSDTLLEGMIGGASLAVIGWLLGFLPLIRFGGGAVVCGVLILWIAPLDRVAGDAKGPDDKPERAPGS